ncbi:LOW QUALITY PROTEIN: rho GTPase-activating protein 40 [Megaptera novaeangliae]
MALVALASPCPQIPWALIARRLGRCAWRWADLGCREPAVLTASLFCFPTAAESEGLQVQAGGETFIMDSAYSEQAVLLLQRGRRPPGGTCTCAGDKFRIPQGRLGLTRVGDLSLQDKKVPALALIELTTLCDVLGLDLKKSKAGKRKATETCLFSVSLDTLLEADRRSLPSTQVPLVLQALLSCLEERGLDTSGILRVPGSKLWCPQVVQHDVLGKALLEFFPVAREPSNKMMLWSVSTEMAPHLFQHRGGPPKLPRGREKQLAEGAAEVVRMIARYQDLPWTVAFLVAQVKLNDSIRRCPQLDEGLKTWLRRMHADRNEAMDGPELAARNGAADCGHQGASRARRSERGGGVSETREVTRLSKEETVGRNRSTKSADILLHEVRGNISEHRLDPDAHLLDLCRTNPHGEWVIKQNPT